jgi:DNA-directed RNA polymerase subunit beta'
VIVGRLIPAGTAWPTTPARRRTASGLTESELEALSGAMVTEATPEPEAAASESARSPAPANLFEATA